MTVSMSSSSLKAALRFTQRDEKFKTEKPYELEYQPDVDIPQKNFAIEIVSDIPINDMRPFKNSLSLDREGIAIVPVDTRMEYDDYFNEEKLKTVFGPELKQCIMDYTGAERVYFHETVVCHPDCILNRVALIAFADS